MLDNCLLSIGLLFIFFIINLNVQKQRDLFSNSAIMVPGNYSWVPHASVFLYSLSSLCKLNFPFSIVAMYLLWSTISIPQEEPWTIMGDVILIRNTDCREEWSETRTDYRSKNRDCSSKNLNFKSKDKNLTKSVGDKSYYWVHTTDKSLSSMEILTKVHTELVP